MTLAVFLECKNPSSPPDLALTRRELPPPDGDQVQIKIAATSVNPIDVKRAAGYSLDESRGQHHRVARSNINAAIRRKARTAHLDAGSSDEYYRRIAEAREVLLEQFVGAE